MPVLTRRDMLIGTLATTFITAPALARPRAEIWTFDDLTRIGGHPVRVEGAPILVDSPLGAALTFDGEDDALFIDHHPLAGAERFTFEALFRPDGGAFEQRWFHLESDQTPPVAPGTGTTRMLFEIRVVEDHWYLDAFMRGDGYNQVLIVPEKRFPVGAWYHVAQSYDGTTYRSYVNGALQAEAAVPFKPQGPGKASVGIRMNRVNPFKGAVRQAAFVKGEAKRPGEFVLKRP
ncbi:hypothetical protein FHS96_004137 [Sphingomonas zeicaulis]|uniref:LamG-like jellyroll fold domain-containing protein n=1 Tax=Sphingomonas zeicaulis TaxID=1632740 RepID=UPI003D1E5CD7